MLQFPATFEARVSSLQGTSGTWPIEASDYEAQCSVPEEFGGSGGAFSPEDLFALALANCFVATFKVYAEASRVNFHNVIANATLTVDRDPNGQPIMSHCLLDIWISGAERPERVETLVQKALRSGFILNSVKTRIESRLHIETGLNVDEQRNIR